MSTLLFRFVESDDISEETGTLICEALVPLEDIIALTFFLLVRYFFAKVNFDLAFDSHFYIQFYEHFSDNIHNQSLFERKICHYIKIVLTTDIFRQYFTDHNT